MFVETKEAVDMTPKEYRKFIYRSGQDRPAGWERKIITLNATGSGLDRTGELKQAVDMSSSEYAKFIAKSGVQNTHGGGKIVTLNASGIIEMTWRERSLTGLGIVVGGAGLLIATNEVLKKMKKEKFPMLGFIAVLAVGVTIGGWGGKKLGKKWQEKVDRIK